MLETLKLELLNVNQLIMKLDMVLDSAQPNAKGKIRVLFWYTQGKKYDKEPVIVEREEVLKKIPKRVSHKNLSKKAKSTGLFIRNYSQTIQLLALLSELYDYRLRVKEKVALIESIARSTINMNKNRLYDAEQKIELLNKIVYGNLKEDDLLGYYKTIVGPIIPKPNS